MHGKQERETFIRRFPCGMVAVMTFAVAEGRLVDWRCSWNRKLTRKRVARFFAEYSLWRNESFQAVQAKHGLGGAVVIDAGAEPIVNFIPGGAGK